MRKLIVVALAAAALGLAVLAIPASAEAPPPTWAPCWWSYGGNYQLKWTAKPRACDFNGGEAHAYQVPIRNIRWRSWGGPVAYGRGTYFYNMGYRAPIRFRLYRRQLWEDGIRFYTRLRGTLYDRDRGPIRVRSKL